MKTNEITPAEALSRLDLTEPYADIFLETICFLALARNDLDAFIRAFEMYLELTFTQNTFT